MNLSGNWSYPTTIKFGAGRIQELPQACAALGIEKPLLVTDRGLATLPITQDTLHILERASFTWAMFSNVDPNPTEVRDIEHADRFTNRLVLVQNAVVLNGHRPTAEIDEPGAQFVVK